MPDVAIKGVHTLNLRHLRRTGKASRHDHMLRLQRPLLLVCTDHVNCPFVRRGVLFAIEDLAIRPVLQVEGVGI